MDRKEVYANRFLAGCVERYHTWPTITSQTVGQHCWRVTCIVVEIFGMPSAEVLYYALNHDGGELWAGDLPFGAKRDNNKLMEGMAEAEAHGLSKLGIELPALTELDRAKVKIADLLEMREFGMHERLLGNKYAVPITQDTLAAARQIAALYELTEKVEEWINKGGDRD